MVQIALDSPRSSHVLLFFFTSPSYQIGISYPTLVFKYLVLFSPRYLLKILINFLSTITYWIR